MPRRREGQPHRLMRDPGGPLITPLQTEATTARAIHPTVQTEFSTLAEALGERPKPSQRIR
jgi:hypothetical protein